MVARVGVGATAAAAVIFSILLASNVLVFAASQDRERLYSVSDAEDSLSDSAQVLMGAGGINILSEAQAALEAIPLGCQTAGATVAALVGNLTDFQRFGGVAVASTARLAPEGSARDNLSVLGPFDGSVSGELDVEVSMSVAGSSPSGEVSIARSEAHLVHLPVELDRLSTDCLGALDGIVHTLSGEAPANCTSRAVAPLVVEASRSAAAEVTADGFVFGVAYTIVPAADCIVALKVQVLQPGIVGPGGPFKVRLEEEGLASFGQPTSAQQGGISRRTGP